MGASIMYLKYHEKKGTARMRYRDNGATESVLFDFNNPDLKDFEHGIFSQNISILLADNFLSDVSGMSKQASQELTRIQPLIAEKVGQE